MEQPLRAVPSPARRVKLVVGMVVIALTLSGLVAWAMGRPGSSSFYLTVAELKAQGQTASEDYRVNGNVVPGTFLQDGIRSSFQITDGEGRLTVVTDQPLPDAFSTGYQNDPSSVEVVAEGRFDGEALTATRVLAKCPSKFKTKA